MEKAIELYKLPERCKIQYRKFLRKQKKYKLNSNNCPTKKIIPVVRKERNGNGKFVWELYFIEKKFVEHDQEIFYVLEEF
ncbi:MAG: hypothetical protein HQK76_09370 [Desulfobacterales bacterium]|nr:hypothetical protein [Desulfobacterales bacterium]